MITKLDFCFKYTRFSHVTFKINGDTELEQLLFAFDVVRRHQRDVTIDVTWKNDEREKAYEVLKMITRESKFINLAQVACDFFPCGLIK